MKAEDNAIFADAITDSVIDIVEPTKRLVDGYGRKNKSIKWSDDNVKEWSNLIKANGTLYLTTRTDLLDVQAFTEDTVAAALDSIKHGHKLTLAQRNELTKTVLTGVEELQRRIERIREQIKIPSDEAQKFIGEALSKTATNWAMPDEYAFEAAQEIDESLHPTLALIKASTYIQRLRRRNNQQKERVKKARALREKLKEEPITNAGQRGIRGLLRRWLLASLNGTPFNNLNWIEVNHEGLQIYTPLSPVSQRTVKQAQLVNNAIVLSVDPPAYLDWLIGVLRQFRRNIQTPIGQIIVYEPGSGRNLAEAVALWPDAKIKEMRNALEQLALLENPYQRYARLPRLRDILIYYDFAGTDFEELENLLTTDSEEYADANPATTPADGETDEQR